jgi:hypothetical protein
MIQGPARNVTDTGRSRNDTEDVKSQLRTLAETINGAYVLSYTQKPEFSETMEYQH